MLFHNKVKNYESLYVVMLGDVGEYTLFSRCVTIMTQIFLVVSHGTGIKSDI